MNSDQSQEDLIEQFRIAASAVQASYHQLEYEILTEGVDPWESQPAPGAVELPNLAPLYLMGILVAGLTQASIIVDQHLKVVSTNEPAATNFGLGEGTSLEGVVSDESLKRLQQMIDSAESQGGVEMILQDGSSAGTYDCIYLDNPIEKGRLLLLVAQDLEMRQMREVEDQILKNLTGTLVHEIRTPLTSMQGFAELLLQVQSLEPSESDKLQMIRSGIDRLNLLASALSTVFQEIVEPRWAKLEINAFFKHSLERIRSGRELDISSLGLIELEEELQVVSDPELLYLAIEELAGNALDEQDAKEVPIIIELTSDDKDVRIVVTNQASIMPGNNVENWWVPFFTNKSGHLGLGLIKVRRILEGLGGTVAQHEISGSEVKLELTIPI